MYKYLLLLLTLFSISSASESIDAVTLEEAYYEQTNTSLTYKDAKLSYSLPTISYIGMRPNYLFLAAVKLMPKQKIGMSALGATPIKLEQEAWKYEVGAGYKFYLSKNFYVGPALLYGDYYSKVYQTIGSSTVETKNRDVDVRLYGFLGYEPAKATLIFITLELDNDILSNQYEDDYSQYALNAALYQFVSKEWFFYLKYQRTLRDKKATTASTGMSNSTAYFFGVGMKF